MNSPIERLQRFRPALRSGGLALMVVGGGLVVFGAADFIACQAHAIVSKRVILAFVGMPLLASGLAAHQLAAWLESRAAPPGK